MLFVGRPSPSCECVCLAGACNRRVCHIWHTVRMQPQTGCFVSVMSVCRVCIMPLQAARTLFQAAAGRLSCVLIPWAQMCLTTPFFMCAQAGPAPEVCVRVSSGPAA